MKNNFALKLTLTIVSIALNAWTSDSHRLPIREIDRSLILPKHMGRESLIQNSIIDLNDESAKSDETTVGFIPSLPSYSLTDNLLWEAIPVPLFRYLLTHNNINLENGSTVKNLSVTLDGGMTSFVITPEGSTVGSTLGFSAKKPLLNWLWSEGNVKSFFENMELLSLGSSLGLGWQISDKSYLISSYNLQHIFLKGDRLYHGLTLEAGVNFNSNITFAFHLSEIFGTKKQILNPGATLSLQW